MKIVSSALLLATGASAAVAYTQIASSNCEADGMVPVTDPAECHAAIKSTLGVEYPYITLYGNPGCDIGSDGVDYGFCNGGSNSKPTGCSQKGKYFYFNNGNSDAACETYQCLCKSGEADTPDEEAPPATTEAPATEAPIDPTPPPATQPPATEPPATEAPVQPTAPPATEPPVVVVEPEQPEEPTPVAPVTCPRGAMTCADGSAVGRDPDNNCEFFACPPVLPTLGGNVDPTGDNTVAADTTGDKKLGGGLGGGLDTPLGGDLGGNVNGGTAVAAEDDRMAAADKAKIEAAVNGMNESDDLDLASLSLVLGSDELAQRLIAEADQDQSGSVNAEEVKQWWAQQLAEEETSDAYTATLSVATAAIVCAFAVMA